MSHMFAYEYAYQCAYQYVCVFLHTFHRWDDLVFIVDVQPVG